jgi:hypothetical protein
MHDAKYTTNFVLTSFLKYYSSAAFQSLDSRIFQSYNNPMILKTDAPASTVYDIMKFWKKSNSKTDEDYLKKVSQSSHNYNLLQKPINLQKDPDFSATKSILKEKKQRIPTYLPNPTKNWGPKSRAKKIHQNEETK